VEEIESEYWRLVEDRGRHVVVYSGSIDCAGVGWGFPIPKASNKHPWNLKVLANNQGSVLRSMGPVMGMCDLKKYLVSFLRVDLQDV
jgi:hypothetical protein